jgi:hypothetical protein
MKLMLFATALALAAGTTAVPAATANADNDVKLVGCVVKADDGYVLTNVVATPHVIGTGGATPMPTPAPAPAAAEPIRTFYWLEDDDDLEGHAGHRVEVVGELEDIERGQISVEREDDMIELEFKVDGDKKVTVKVPDTPAAAAAVVGTAGTVTDRERDINVKVKKVDVKSVKVVAQSCL